MVPAMVPAMNRRQRGESAMKSPFYTAEHGTFRDVMRRFVEKEIEPFAHEWDEAGEFPRVLIARRPRLACWGSDSPRNMAGSPPTSL
jgi:acyl-CoA dehydrogenase